MLAGVGAIKGYPFIIDNHVMLFCTGIAGDGRWMAYHKMRHLRAFIREYLEKNPNTPTDGTWPLDLWCEGSGEAVINAGLMFLEWIEPDFMAAVAILDTAIKAWLWEAKAQPRMM